MEGCFVSRRGRVPHTRVGGKGCYAHYNSTSGNLLEAVAHDFKIFRTALERTVPKADRSRGGRPAFDYVLFKVSSILGSRGCPVFASV